MTLHISGSYAIKLRLAASAQSGKVPTGLIWLKYQDDIPFYLGYLIYFVNTNGLSVNNFG